MKRKSTFDDHACRECGRNGVDKSGAVRYQWFRIDAHKLQCPTCGDFRDDGWWDLMCQRAILSVEDQVIPLHPARPR